MSDLDVHGPDDQTPPPAPTGDQGSRLKAGVIDPLLKALDRLLRLVPFATDEEIEIFGALTEESAREHLPLDIVAYARQRFRPRYELLYLDTLGVRGWHDGGARHFLPERMGMRRAHQAPFDPMESLIASYARDLVESLASRHLVIDTTFQARATWTAVEGLVRATRITDPAAALRLLHQTMRLPTPPATAESELRIIYDLLNEVDDAESRCSLTAIFAEVSLTVAQARPTAMVEAFDRIECAVERAIVSTAAADRPAAVMILHRILETLNEPLRSLLSARLEDRRPKADLPRVRDTGKTAEAEFLATAEHEVPIERFRATLRAPAVAVSATTDWYSGIMSHPLLVDVIPHGNAFAADPQSDDLLLTVAHEATHAMCLHGDLAASSFAMRVAYRQALTTLWAHRSSADASRCFDAVQVARTPLLDRLEPATLASAQRILEISRRILVLQETWTPWLEGIAVFSETAAPKPPYARCSHVTPLVTELNDLIDGARGLPCGSIEEQIAAMEGLHFRAASALRTTRLRGYFESGDGEYLWGYLAVRAVVGSWRRRLGGVLSASDAATLLIHATRRATDEFVPDLTHMTFDDACKAGLRQFVRQLAKIPAERLERYRNAPPQGFTSTWSNAIPTVVERKSSLPQLAARDNDLLRRRLSQAYAIMFGGAVPGGRARDEWQQASVEVMSVVLERNLREYLGDDAAISADIEYVKNKMTDATFLPIGEVSAKFWLDRSSRALCVLLRSLRPMGAGEKSFDTLVLPIPQKSADLLAAEYRRLGAPRLTCTRIARLGVAGTRTYEDAAQILAFSYGEWLHLKPAGAAATSPALSDADEKIYRSYVTDRLRAQRGPSGLEYAEAVDMADVARSLRRWVANPPLANNSSLEFWAAHVEDVASEVVTRATRPTLRSASANLAHAAFGGDIAMVSTIGEWFPKDPVLRTELVEALASTADAPQGGIPPALQFPISSRPMFSETGAGWDVMPVIGDTP